VDGTHLVDEEQVRFYERNGYIQLHDILSHAELEQVRTAVDDALAMRLDARHDMGLVAAHDSAVFVQKINLWQVHPGVRHYVFNPMLAEIARRLMRARRVRLWHDHVLVKMPGDSKASEWHQDLPFWPMVESVALSCWMALDDVTEANGCLAFVPGSHRLGRLDPLWGKLKDPRDLVTVVPGATTAGIELKGVFQPMRAGSCTFHNGLTLHYAGPNTTDRPRRAMGVGYMADGTRFNGADHVVTRDLSLQVGAVLAGEVFPVLAAETEDMHNVVIAGAG
jgi:ectoine hydroxylase-related dioxygenase (phytanoyl-CoA dioxygenase family)